MDPSDVNRLLKLGASSLSLEIIRRQKENCAPKTTEQLMSKAFIGSLWRLVPKEITVLIFSHFDVASASVASRVCKKWSLLVNDSLWSRVVTRQFNENAKHKPDGISWRQLAIASLRVRRLWTPLQYPFSFEEHPELHAEGWCTLVDPEGDSWLGEIRDRQLQHVCIRMQLNKDSDKKLVYSGECSSKGIYHGFGEIQWTNGNSYKGHWENGTQSGEGEYRWKDGDWYKGFFKDNRRTGKGFYSWAGSDITYEGEFNNNYLQGYGVYTWKNGVYEGEWNLSTRTGQATVTWCNGNVFKGTYNNNKKCGYGVFTWNDGAQYKGTWEDNDRSGDPCETLWANGMRYLGSYAKDKRHGRGCLFWPNGDTFRGTWKAGGRSGQGVFKCAATGSEARQVWHEAENIQYSEAIPERSPEEYAKLLVIHTAPSKMLIK